MPNEWREIEGFPPLGLAVTSALDQLEPLQIHEVENRVNELIERCLSAALTEFTRTLA